MLAFTQAGMATDRIEASTAAGVRTDSSLPSSGSAGSARQVKVAQASRWSGWGFIAGSFHEGWIGTRQAVAGAGWVPTAAGSGGGYADQDLRFGLLTGRQVVRLTVRGSEALGLRAA
jgi:hypothetical protein